MTTEGILAMLDVGNFPTCLGHHTVAATVSCDSRRCSKL